MSETAAAPADELRTVALERLRESGTNPRKHFNAEADRQLLESVKAKGVLFPLLVRPAGHDLGHVTEDKRRYEIVAGARRYRAAKAAGLKSVCVVVRDLDDKAALEAQVIENLQRADVHPLDEADGYAALIKSHGYDVAGIAKKIGKCASYVYQRLQLAKLIGPLKKAFWSGDLKETHAVQLARLDPVDQKESLAWLWRKEWSGDLGQWHANLISSRELAAAIARKVHRSLAAAPWRKDDAALLPKAGACTACPLRAGNQPELFADVAKAADVCTKPDCYEAKFEAHARATLAELRKKEPKAVALTEEWKGKDGVLGKDQYAEISAKQRDCRDTRSGVFMDGDRRGQKVRVCVAKDCKPHGRYGGPSRPATDWQAQRRREAQRKAHEAEIERRVMAAFLPKVDALAREDLQLIAHGFFSDVWYGRRQKILSRHKWESAPPYAKLSEKELRQLLLEIALTDRNQARLARVARRHGVNAKKIAADYARERKAKKKAGAKKAAAKK